ncbi:MAG TPA: P1 family peptidase [Vicinamibacterales bacterium]|nr:P1 family peptidase [Vicinamibacterales bacterium]
MRPTLALAAILTLCSSFPFAQERAVRARDLGIPFQGGRTGPFNAITDVAGVEVGLTTLISGEGALVEGKGPIRTGVTAILPRGRKFDPVFAAYHVLNGNGDMTGTHWVQESGFLETPILITNTGSVGVVRDAALAWMNRNQYFSPLVGHVWFAYPLVAETYDGVLNDMYGFHVKPEHVFAALDAAKGGPVAEGNVGGGTGMSCLGFKCGTGTASRVVVFGPQEWTLGVLVQANFGGRNQLTMGGVQVGREIKGAEMQMNFGKPGGDDAAGRGSIIAIAATDAPLAPHQLRRIAQRISLGIGRTGGTGGNGSGDIFLAFSTANPGAFRRGGASSIQMMSNDDINGLLDATVDATEEAILNAMIAAKTMTGANGNTIFAIPHDQVRDILRKYGRLK